MMRSLVLLLLFGLWMYVLQRSHPTLFTMKELVPKDRFDLVYGPWGIVLGASEGIGLEWAYALAERGVDVVMVSRDLAKLEEARESLRRAVPNLTYRIVAVDLDDVEAVRSMVTKLSKEIQVGIVVYNAAYSAVGPFASYKTHLHERTLNVNVHSPLIVVSAFLDGMVERKRGAIVLMSSLDGEGCSPQTAHYAGTKSWATRLAEGLWYELRDSNVHVLGVVAGLTSTRAIDGVFNPELRAKVAPFIESKPRDVVMESLAALGRDSPVVIPGFVTKLIAFSRWISPRFIDCEMIAKAKVLFRSPAELSSFAEATTKSNHRETTKTSVKQEL